MATLRKSLYTRLDVPPWNLAIATSMGSDRKPNRHKYTQIDYNQDLLTQASMQFQLAHTLELSAISVS